MADHKNDIRQDIHLEEPDQVWFSTPEAKAAGDYWNTLLSGCEPDCEPEHDRWDDGESRSCLERDFSLDEAAFSELCHRAGCSGSGFFTAAYALLSSVFTGREDVLFDTFSFCPVGKNGDAAGMSVRVLPFRIHLPEQGPVDALLKQADEQLQESRLYSKMPYRKLAETYGLRQQPGFSCLLDSGEKRPEESPAEVNLRVSGSTADVGSAADVTSAADMGSAADVTSAADMSSAADVDSAADVEQIYSSSDGEAASLFLELSQCSPGAYRIHLDYRSDYFSPEWAECFVDTYVQITEEFLTKDSLEEVSFVPEKELRRLEDFNKTETPRDMTDIVTQFRRCAALHPDSDAVVAEGRHYSYKEADRLTDALAGYLRAQGIGKGSVVSVLIPRNEFMPLASLGVLKSGAAYQPLDPSYPETRLSFMTEDSKAALLITDRSLRDKLSAWQKPVLFTDEILTLPDAEPFDAEIQPDDLFVLLYTSGTTGTPKGGMIQHSNVLELTAWAHRYFKMDEHTRYGAYSSYGFDAHMLENYSPLTCGGTIYVISDETRLDLGAMTEFINENGITDSVMTTQVGRQLSLVYEGGSLKNLLVGGETLVPIDPEKIHCTLHNGYGPSECTLLATVQPVDRLYHRIPVGEALENVKLYVVDKKLRRLPFFAPGELLIAGPHVGKGYLNLPEKTAASFLENPFTQEEGYERVYRTGDVVRMLADGKCDFIGRSDSQVKVRGFRIELPEVEEVIREFPGIRDATVQAFSDENSGLKYLAAYVVSDEAVDVSALNAFIKERKPPYMVPAVTMQIDAIPLTQNSKVDKRALPLPRREEASEVSYEQPATEEERIAFDCAARALGHTGFGVLSDLEEVGLSSIQAMELNVLLSEAFHRTVRLRDMKDLHTVRDIAAFFSTSSKEQGYVLQESYPLSSVQQGIYVECLTNPDSTTYNLPILLKLDPAVDLMRLKDALTAAIDAHPYLKARLKASPDGEIMAVRDDKSGIVIDMLNKKDLHQGFSGLVRPFRLTQEPLMRAALIADKPSSFLFFDAHHLIFDGESLGIFMRDLEKAYAGTAPEKEVFTGYEAALDEQQLRRSTAYEEAKAYYSALLEDVDVDCLPVRDRNEAIEEAGILNRSFSIDKKEIERFLSEGKTTGNALWNAAFGFTLAKFLGREDCVYSTVYNGRNDSRLTDSVGMFVHTMPAVCRIKAGETGRSFTARLGRQLSDSMSNDIFSFAEICHTFGVRPDVLFVYEGEIGTSYTVGGRPAEQVVLHQPGASKAALTFCVFDTETGFRIECEYETEHYEEWDIQSMLESMENALRAILRDQPLDKISLLTPEAEELLASFNRTEKEIEDTDIPALFRSCAERFPDSTALIFNGKHLTYREADEMSDRIAAYAMDLGIGPEDVVSILAPRSEYMIISALGVLKTGAAYQPLDPGYPSERLQFMISDAGPKLLISDESLTGLLPDYKGPVLLLQDIPSLPQTKPAAVRVRPDDLFILLYTSGTTGQPKGVMLTRRNLVNFCSWYRDYYSLLPESVVAAYASFGFDASMMDTWPALTTGAAVCIVPEEIRLDLNVLNRYYKENGVTHVFMTTQMGRMFASQITETSIHCLSVGGEKLVPLPPPEGFSLTNAYGPTECTIFSTTQKVDRLYDRIPIGSPVSNYKLYVVDSFGQELPVGAMGELWIAGYGVGRGYLNLQEKTDQVFTANPFCSAAGFDRVFRTGDIVRRLGDGRIDFIGRNDGQVKIRGFRIELAEVEGAIREYEGIRDVTVQAFEDEAFGGKYIAAYVVSDALVDFGRVGEFIRKKKPAYMVPAAFMQLDAIPLNRNHKVDKRALPKPERQGGNKDFVEPATPLEREICAEYASILGLDKVSATDSFFDIGGSSISAAEIVMFAMNKGYEIVYKDVFNNPSPRELARVIVGLGKGGKAGAAADFDYTEINRLIDFNTMEHVDEISEKPIGNIILFGATGFLGIHVLRAFLQNCEGTITCLMRRGTYSSAERRLVVMLMYYFGQNMEEEFGKRIFCIEGDITDPDSMTVLDSLDADTVINCAACVKHFAKDDILDRINVQGVENLVDLCVRSSKRLVQISTLSIGGEIETKNLTTLKENMLYFGQNVENDYVRTKFMAERVILDARLKRGLDAVILRAGNLMGRSTDGEFQINFETNSFIRSLWAYIHLGECPVTILENTEEFSPIDSVASAVLKLAGADSRFSIFHVYNNHTVTMADILAAIRSHGFDVKTVSEEHFRQTLAETAKHEEESRTVISLMAYANRVQEDLKEVKGEQRFTTNALFRLNFKWPIIDDAYLERLFWSLDTLGFFSLL